MSTKSMPGPAVDLDALNKKYAPYVLSRRTGPLGIMWTVKGPGHESSQGGTGAFDRAKMRAADCAEIYRLGQAARVRHEPGRLSKLLAEVTATEDSESADRIQDALSDAVEGLEESHAFALAERLRSAYPCVEVRCADFLQCNGDLGTFDRIVMNPPFGNADDIKHIEHARTMLKPGGRLVAICAAGPRQRAAFETTASEWIDLDPGTFEESGTSVSTAIVVFEGGAP